MNVLEEAILTSTQIDDRDVRVILTAIGFQNREGVVRQKQIADLLNVSVSTVERRFRKFKNNKLVLVTRVKAHEWRYDFSPLLSNVNLHPSDGPPHEINTSSITKEIWKETSLGSNNKNNIYTVSTQGTASSRDKDRKDSKMASVTGPPSELKDACQTIIDKSSKVPKKRERYEVRRDKQYERFKTKSVNEYNCNDMWYIFRESWRKKNWKGRPIGWTAADRKKMKSLIQEQGAEIVVALIQYVIEEWDDICRRYHTNGFPSAAAIFGYRRSWLPEALNGKQQSSGAEWTGGEDLPPGSWG